MITSLAQVRRPRTSWIDRAWANYWSVLSMSPIDRPEPERLRADLLDFMAADPANPINCELSADGRRWLEIPAWRREQHVDRALVTTGPIDTADPYAYIHRYAPAPTDRAPYRVVVGPDSLTCYVSHSLGDAVVVSSFGVLLALGDVHGLRFLRPDSGMSVAARLLVSQAPAHYRQWWRHFRSPSAPSPASGPGVIPAVAPAQVRTEAVAHRVNPDAVARLQRWRKETQPGVSTSALVASAAYLALRREGVALNPDGCYTLIDLRRYLPGDQALRPGNLVKSVYIPARMSEARSIADGIRDAVESARSVPALAIGSVAGALRPKASPEPSEISSTTMTFNYMMRNPGTEHIPWQDPSTSRYLTMSYPCAPDNLAVFACGVSGGIDFSASFAPEFIDKAAVQRALRALDDMPGLLSAEPARVRATG